MDDIGEWTKLQPDQQWDAYLDRATGKVSKTGDAQIGVATEVLGNLVKVTVKTGYVTPLSCVFVLAD